MAFLLYIVSVYLIGMVLTAIGSRLAARCATWCAALCGLPMWVVNGTVTMICVALPQLMLAFLAAGLSITGLAVGASLASAVAALGLVLALCLLRREVRVDRHEFCSKCLIMLGACLTLLVFVRDGLLSYTGTGLLMALFVLFVLQSIACRYEHLYAPPRHLLSVSPSTAFPDPSGLHAHTMIFPAMNLRNSLRNLTGVVAGTALLALGASIAVYSTTALANLTGTIQALWATTLLAFGFSLPLLAEAFHHPFGTVWKRFSEACRFYPAETLPMQLLNTAIVSLTLVLPLSSLMYRHRLPVGAQFRHYDIPLCLALTLVLLVPPLCKKRLYRWQGVVCLTGYLVYLTAALLAPLAGA